MSLQSQTFERLCVGQLHETTGPGEGVDPVDHYFSVLADKTGSLISAAARSGIRYSGAPAEFEEPARIFGEKIGIAFQLADDVIDLSPSSDSTGKKAGTDLKAGVPTLPTLLLERVVDTDPEAASLLKRLRDDAQSTDAAAEADLPEAVRALYDHPVTQTTRDEALRFAREAMEALEPLPDNAAKRALGMFADHVVSRTG
jgi:heptaprenyl diphosphate synthase